MRSVNLACAALSALVICACGPGPRPIPPGESAPYATVLGNARRALFENELVPDSPTVAWDVNAGSGIRGTLLLIDSAVLTASTNRQMLAYHRDSGRRYWDQRFNAAVTGSVLFDGHAIYVATTEMDGELFALEVERGRRIWRADVGPVRFTPLLDNGMIYLGTDRGVVMAMQTARGARVWRATLGAGIAETVLDAGANVIAFTTADSVFALRKSDGAIVTRGTIAATPSAAPAVFGTTVIVPTHKGSIIGLDLRTLATLWRVETGGPVLTAPVVTHDSTIYVATREGGVFSIRDGRASKLADVGHAVSSSLTLGRDRLLLGSYDGTLIALSTAGEIIWQWRLDDSIVAPVALADGGIYIPLLRGRIVKLR